MTTKLDVFMRSGSVEFATDSEGNLYLNGKRVQTVQILRLNIFVAIAAILGGLGAFFSGVIDLIRLIR